MNEYDVIIHMNEPRYWALLLGSFACGLALIRRFQRLKGNVLERALKQMGWVLIALQVAYQIYGRRPRIPLDCAPVPPLLFCGINIWLVALNYWRNRTVYLCSIQGTMLVFTPSSRRS